MVNRFKYLVADDEQIVRNSLKEWLTESGYEIYAAATALEALQVIQRNKVDILIADLKMPGMDGIELMKRAKLINPSMFTIIITAFATVPTAIVAMKEGAYDYLEKPFCPEKLELILKKIEDQRNLMAENLILRQELEKRYHLNDIIGKSHSMQKIFEMVKTVAKSNSTILIQGESGTGKELIARAIHDSSSRKERPFIAISCASIPESLLESELFGHERGSFTGAVSQRKGKFELAHNGTLFLDEVGEMNLSTQVHLLRVLQEKEFRRVGGTELVKVDVRIVSATNKNIKKLVNEGRFREDLYYRLNVVTIDLPPLRERREDILPIAYHFLKKFSSENRKEVNQFSQETLEFIVKYNWHGNVRELENAIEHAVVVCKGNTAVLDDLPSEIRNSKASANGHSALKSIKDIERDHIMGVLESTNWNRSRAAQILGIERATLYNKLRSYGLMAKK
ncbi:MAG: sigma-54 dependent transcriptional regulator [Firmicutes bacterium]|nr:sigma-54 dependent transcriptional regulator [Bacillota bacterium]